MSYRQTYDDELVAERRARRLATVITWPKRLSWMAIGIALGASGVFAFLGKYLG